MVLQIVVPGTFTASGLPDLGLLGFEDTFNRPDAEVLGSTETPRRLWATNSTQPTEGGVLGGEAYVRTTTTATQCVATADGRSADGVLECTLGNFGAGQAGVAFRVSSTTNAFRLCSIDGAAYRLSRVASGVTTTLWQSSGVTPTIGDVLKVTMDGPLIEVYVNGANLFDIEDAHNQTVTRHGFWNNTTTTANRIRDISFVAA